MTLKIKKTYNWEFSKPINSINFITSDFGFPIAPYEHFLQIGIYHTILQDALFVFETDKLNGLVTLIGLSRVDAKLTTETNYGSRLSESINKLIQMISILESDY